MKRLLFPAALLVASPVAAQTLPAPQFATPATADSSAHAATTAWVRAQSYLTTVGDLSQATVRAPGSTVARTASARAGDVYNVLDYGAVADGATDIGPVLNILAAKLGSSASSNVIYFPAGSYRIATPVVFNGVAPILQGQGFAQGPFQTGWTGTWIKVDTSGVTPFIFENTNARGAKVRDLALYEVHPTPATGWTPTPNDFVFKALNTLGEVTFDNVLFAGVNQGIYADNSGRLNVKDVQGQFYTNAVTIDDCYDIPHIGRLHAWTFASSSPSVVSYQEAHEDTVVLKRVDGIFINDLFTLGAHSAIHFTTGINGVTTKAYVNNLYADFVTYGVWIDANAVTAQFANVTTQHNDQTNAGTDLAGGQGLYVTGNNAIVQLSNWQTSIVAGSAIDITGTGNTVAIGRLTANTYGTPGAGGPAIFVADSGSSPANTVTLGQPPKLQGTAPLYLFNTGVNAGRETNLLINRAGNDVNEPRGYSSAAGGPVSITAIGGDPAVNLQLQATGNTGTVRLQSNGVTALRTDNANNVADDVLVRAGAGALNFIAEGSDANVDFYLSPKGPTGGVRLQGSGQTVLRVDDLNSSADDLLVRGGSGSMNVIAEGGDTNIDAILTPKGSTGGVRLQANGTTVLREDNPNTGTSDLLVRSGTATLGLTVEDPAANANLVLNPKGYGFVSTANCPASSDSSSNLACTSTVRAWVGSLGYATAASLGPLATQAALASKTVVGTNGSGQLVAATTQGNGSKVQLSNGSTTSGDCVKFDASGNTVDAGAACGTGSGTGGITALTGDVTASGTGTVAATLAAVGNAGTYGSATTIPVITTDAKGRVTGVSVGAAVAPAASPTLSGTTTISGTNGITLAGAASGSAPSITATGGDSSVDLALSALGTSGSVRLFANGGNVLRVANLGSGNSDVLVQSGTGVASLSVESGSSAANLALNPKGSGVVSAPTPVASDNSTTVATTAFVKAQGYGSGTLTGLSGDVTASGTGTVAATLASVGTAGTYGSATSIPAITTDAKGRVTGVSVGAAVLPAASPAATGGASSLSSAANNAKSGTILLVANTTNTTAARLTSDGNAAGAANCVNLPANSAMKLYIDVVSFDTTTGASAATFRWLDVLMLKGATNATTAITNQGSSAPNGTIGTAGFTYATSADTTNGCLNLTATAPNSDAWHTAARVFYTQVQ